MVANRKLSELKNLWISKEHNKRFQAFLSDNAMGSPHFGVLWEAAVKSIKQHLKRTITATKLTYNELYTVIVQIEACLNLRSLMSLSNDPDDQ